MDHMLNFRGPGWNWAIPVLPTYPPFVKQALGEDPSVESKTGVSRIGFKRPDTRKQLFWDRGNHAPLSGVIIAKLTGHSSALYSRLLPS